MKKRVCHISYNHNAFDDRIYWKELLALTEAGYECVHICVGEVNEDFISNEGIRIISVKKVESSINIWINRLRYFLFRKSKTIQEIFNKARELQANVYHYHDLQLNTLSKPLKNLPWNPAVIYDTHEAYHLLLLEGEPVGLLKKLFVKKINKWELKNANYCNYIIVTDSYTHDYFKKKIPFLPCSIIHNYSYFPAIEPKFHSKEYDFIYTGLMSEERGLFEMAIMVSNIKKLIPSVKMLLIGSFENEQIEKDFKNFIEIKNLQRHIFIKDQVKFSEINKYYRSSKIGLCLLHQTPKYNISIPIKLFEYMAFGLPTIFSNHGPSAKIIESEHCGIVVEIKNSYAIQMAALSLLNDGKLYEEQRKNGQKAINEKYSWQREKLKLLKIYTHLFND